MENCNRYSTSQEIATDSMGGPPVSPTLWWPSGAHHGEDVEHKEEEVQGSLSRLSQGLVDAVTVPSGAGARVVTLVFDDLFLDLMMLPTAIEITISKA